MSQSVVWKDWIAEVRFTVVVQNFPAFYSVPYFLYYHFCNHINNNNNKSIYTVQHPVQRDYWSLFRFEGSGLYASVLWFDTY